jgi:hypothetical protein
MTEQEKRLMHELVTNMPRSVWRFPPFWISAIPTVIGMVVTIYLRTHVSDLEIVLRHEYRIVKVWNSAEVAKMLPSLSMLVTVSFAWATAMGWLSYGQLRLLKALSREAGVEGEGAADFWIKRSAIGHAMRKQPVEFIVPFLAGLGALYLVGVLVDTMFSPANDGILWAVFGAGFFGLLVLLCVRSNLRTREIMRKAGLMCVQCGGFPIGQAAIDRTLEQGACLKCGKRL